MWVWYSHSKYLWCHTNEMDSSQNTDWQNIAQTHGKDFTWIESQLHHSQWNTLVHMYGKHISMCHCVSLDTTDYCSANNKWYLYAKSLKMQHMFVEQQRNSGNVRCIWWLPFHQAVSQYFEWFLQANAKCKLHLLDQREILSDTNMLNKITKIALLLGNAYVRHVHPIRWEIHLNKNVGISKTIRQKDELLEMHVRLET